MDSHFNLENDPHRRYNPLTGRWVLVAPHRLKRPWRGQVEKRAPAARPRYDPGCYLCPGNERTGGARNPMYRGTFVFDNDFPSLYPQNPLPPQARHPLLQIAGERGLCRVICFSPHHDLTLPQMAQDDLRAVVDTWSEQVAGLCPSYRWVQLFQNKGEMMGCSNAHPHGQLWAQMTVPTEAVQEDVFQHAYFQTHGRPLLLDYVELETAERERVVVENAHWLAVVPWWALWPFETLLLPRRHVRHMHELSEEEREALAGILRRLLTRYDNLFESAFPYSMGWHGTPFGSANSPGADGDGPAGLAHWQLHAHFYPPLLRSAEIRKFMVGYEMVGEGQRDLTPEEAAHRLRSVPERHYRNLTAQ